MYEWVCNHKLFSFAVASAAWVLFLYWSALSGPFVYDDLDQIVKNTQLTSFLETFRMYCLTPSKFTNEFRGAGGTNFRPLFWLSLSLDRHIYGEGGASGFHFTNLFIHWLNGILLFTLLRRLQIAATVVAATSMIWLSMPINTEPVAWVSGREYLLCGLFLLLALRAAHAYFLQPSTPRILQTATWSLAALLSHEAGILVFPFALLLAFSLGNVSRRAMATMASAIAIATAIFLGMRELVGAHSGSGPVRFWAIGVAFWQYLAWMAAPIHMSMQRAMSTPSGQLSAVAILATCGTIALWSVAYLLRRIVPVFAAGVIWMSLAILPFCGVVYIYQGMAERYCYFASAGLALAVASILSNRAKSLRQVGYAVILVWVIWGSWRMKARVLDWCDPVALYQSSLEATPDPMLFYNLGWAWRERRDYDKALADYEEAVHRRPEYQEAQASVGQMLSVLGHPKDAIISYGKALDLRPDDAPTRVDLAMTLEQVGDKAGAEQEFARALSYTPNNTSALNDFGSLLVQEGRLDEAAANFQKAIQVNPTDATAYFNLGALFLQMGQGAKAYPLFQKVLQLKPDDQETVAIMSRYFAPK